MGVVGENKIAIGAAAITTLFASHALAADMAVKSAPAVPSPAIYNWTGWYVGVNAGASFGKVKTDFDRGPVTVAITSGGITGSGTSDSLFRSDTSSPDGFIGGGQIGYNWQISPIWVVGLEADIQGALEKDHNTLTDPFSHTSPSGTF
jgi:outer membrane immunogenic protein